MNIRIMLKTVFPLLVLFIVVGCVDSEIPEQNVEVLKEQEVEPCNCNSFEECIQEDGKSRCELKSCSAMNGVQCNGICEGNIQNAKDTENCCIGSCNENQCESDSDCSAHEECIQINGVNQCSLLACTRQKGKLCFDECIGENIPAKGTDDCCLGDCIKFECYTDNDCARNQECIIEDSIPRCEFKSCRDQGGEICNTECSTTMAKASDSEVCCLGECKKDECTTDSDCNEFEECNKEKSYNECTYRLCADLGGVDCDGECSGSSRISRDAGLCCLGTCVNHECFEDSDCDENEKCELHASELRCTLQTCSELGGKVCQNECDGNTIKSSNSNSCCLSDCVDYECETDQQCDDGQAGTVDECNNNECSHTPVTTCNDDDGVCPSGCNNIYDNDCDDPPEITFCEETTSSVSTRYSKERCYGEYAIVTDEIGYCKTSFFPAACKNLIEGENCDENFPSYGTDEYNIDTCNLVRALREGDNSYCDDIGQDSYKSGCLAVVANDVSLVDEGWEDLFYFYRGVHDKNSNYCDLITGVREPIYNLINLCNYLITV